ncbi:hypothetical protein JCM11641_004078 [Rhodosporidiobolus odoratus]
MKRIIVGVDGTWQSALHQQRPVNLSNVSRLLTSIENVDNRNPSAPVLQVKHYISGVGTGEAVGAGAWHGALGEGVLEKVRQGYYFIAENWNEGDEIYLFGFSRGAYIIRLLCTFINLVGILDPKSNLTLFPSIFDGICSKWTPRDGKKGKIGAKLLAPLLAAIKPFKDAQLEKAKGGFLLKVVGLFETVPLYHIHHIDAPAGTAEAPIYLPHYSPFSLPDAPLEPHIENAYHALALNEMRDAFEPLLWRVGEEGVKTDQKLEQTWFTGCHTDVGGGYSIHDLADVSLSWLVARLLPFLSLDLTYLKTISAHPTAPWGEEPPRTAFHFLKGHPRHPLSSTPSSQTYETLHPSILHQDSSHLPTSIQPYLSKPPTDPIFAQLKEYEKAVQANWPVKDAKTLERRDSVTGVEEVDSAPVSEAEEDPNEPHPTTRPLSVPIATVTSSPFLPSSREGISDPRSIATTKRKNKEKKEKHEHKVIEAIKEERRKIRAAGDAPGLARSR